jgi:hypothetical protein
MYAVFMDIAGWKIRVIPLQYFIICRYIFCVILLFFISSFSRKFQMALGGKMRAIIAGGAPLSPDVHEFLRVCLRVNLAQVTPEAGS